MLINLENICDWAGTNPAQRNFVEGERVLAANHILKCGLSYEDASSDEISFTALCLQTSCIRGPPHEINGKLQKTEK